jgi:hypothetical protein
LTQRFLQAGLAAWLGRQVVEGTEMNLRLKHDPIPENASLLAADIVRVAQNVSGVTLDYSVASLQQVDDLIEGMKSEGCTSEQIAETLFGFGCYIGEVFVRHAGASWQRTGQTPMANLGGFPLVIRLQGDSYCNPIGKAFKRLENGVEDSLPFFYAVFVKGSHGIQPVAKKKPWWKFW